MVVRQDPVDWVVVVLDMDVLAGEFLTSLLERYFSSAAALDFDVMIFHQIGGFEQIYGSSPDLSVEDLIHALWVLGPIIDKAAEPEFARLAPAAGAQASSEFAKAQTRYLALETAATGLFYVIVLVWLLASPVTPVAGGSERTASCAHGGLESAVRLAAWPRSSSWTPPRSTALTWSSS